MDKIDRTAHAINQALIKALEPIIEDAENPTQMRVIICGVMADKMHKLMRGLPYEMKATCKKLAHQTIDGLSN